MRRQRVLLVVLISTLALACAGNPPPAAPSALPDSSGSALTLPRQLVRRAEVLTPAAADYARADLETAVKPPGEGNVSRAMVVRLRQDIIVFRLWNGPGRRDTDGRTNRIGSWWTFDAPVGTVQQYRINYEVCATWNDLTWVASCTLRKGAVVAIGPGNSVTAETCQNPDKPEQYAPNERDWQLFISHAFERVGAGKELDCPDESRDYEADPENLAQPKGTRRARTGPPS